MSYLQPSNHPPPLPLFKLCVFINTMQHLFSENTANSIGTSMPLNPLNLYLSTGCLIKARRSVAGYLTSQRCSLSSFLFRRTKRIAQKIVHLRNILFAFILMTYGDPENNDQSIFRTHLPTHLDTSTDRCPRIPLSVEKPLVSCRRVFDSAPTAVPTANNLYAVPRMLCDSGRNPTCPSSFS